MTPILCALPGGAAYGSPACSAADIIAQDPVNCPDSSAPCNIAKVYEVGDGCILRFGERAVVVTPTGKVDVGAGSLTINAGSLSVVGGLITGRVESQNGSGGSITINTSGAVSLQKSGTAVARMDVSADATPGSLDINAGGAVALGGDLLAEGLNSDSEGGTITITAGQGIVSGATNTISAKGDTAEIDIDATGDVDLANVNVRGSSGGDGGTLMLTAAGDVSLHGTIQASAVGSDAGTGGSVSVDAGGQVQVTGPITANGISGGGGGSITINSGAATLTITSTVQADGDAPDGTGGSIMLMADQSGIALSATGVLSARADGTDGGGGSISLCADRAIAIAGLFDVSGGAGGGDANISTDDSLALTGTIIATGRSAFGDGGTVSIMSSGAMQLTGTVFASGMNGGSGGSVSLSADGDLTVSGDLEATGSIPDATGGSLSLESTLGAVTLQAAARLSARADGVTGSGGSILLQAATDAPLAGRLDASGGAFGGRVEVDAGGDVNLSGMLLATGRSTGSGGGSVSIAAGMVQTGNQGLLSIGGTVDVSGGGCDRNNMCGSGGDTDLEGCNVTIPAAGIVRARGGNSGGTNHLTAHEQLVILGTVNATPTSDTAANGLNLLTYPERKPAVVSPTTVQPPGTNQPLPTCNAATQMDCVVACPACGNGVVEFPETCDAGAPAACSGCSALCQVVALPPTCPTQTSTPTLTPTVMRTATAQPTPTPTSTTTHTATATKEATATPSASPSPTPRYLLGDANCDAHVSAPDLTALLTLIDAGAAPRCGADANGDGVLDADDVTATIVAITATAP